MKTGVPIVYIRKRERNLLTIGCAYCSETHVHGAGSKPFGTLNYGHRIEHCNDYDLRRAQKHLPYCAQLTRQRHSLDGYILVDPRVLKRKEADMKSLFDQMDDVAKSFARVTEPEDANFFWIEFRILVRDRRLELTFGQRRELFEIWLDHHRGGHDARQAMVAKRLPELWEKASDLSSTLGYKYLRKRERAKLSADLAAVQNEICALVAPPQYTGPMATWPDAA